MLGIERSWAHSRAHLSVERSKREITIKYGNILKTSFTRHLDALSPYGYFYFNKQYRVFYNLHTKLSVH
ncbi:hypothetical protein PQX77_016178 [Marasmius sp. AFHP31]|nr:hypothetical protein PQX77_016178 [Marasmius sp. AFHP31]